MKINLMDLDYTDLETQLKELGEKSFRAKQIYEWIHKNGISDIDNMTNLSKALRSKLSEGYELRHMRAMEVRRSSDGSTVKSLLQSEADGALIEAVLLGYQHGHSLCISSQVGCNMGCSFCASTIGGKSRNLSAGEMLSQVYSVNALEGVRISHIVIMGMGEPLDNFDSLTKFVIIITDERGYNMSRRNITVSTCGIVPKIYELADMNLGITLAISLHAAFDEKRREIMPIARKYSISELMAACDYFFEKTGRRLTFEYSLIDGFNNGYEDACELAKLAKRAKAHINLIPVNKIDERGYTAPDKGGIVQFKSILEKYKANATVRRSMGQDIDGACGQLRKRYLTN